MVNTNTVRTDDELFEELLQKANAAKRGDLSAAEKLILQEQIETVRVALLEDDELETPSEWCENSLKDPNDPNRPLSIFKYQKIVIDSDARRRVCRWGRRSGKTVMLAIETIFEASTNYNHRIVFVAASKSQVQNFFKTMQLLYTGTKLEPAIRYIKQPHYLIEFTNGSTIAGFVAGMGNDTRQADRIRGQSADLLVIDEMDLISEEALSEAIMPIANTINPTTGLTAKFIACSTPKGKRGRFYHYCQDASCHIKFNSATKKISKSRPDPMTDNGWEEYHFASEINPYWTSIASVVAKGQPKQTAMEYQARSEAGYENAYNQEYMAEFSEDEIAVFQDRFLDDPNNVVPYDMESLKINPANIYIMGVDSNGQSIGAHLIIVEYVNPVTDDPHGGRFRLFRRYVVGTEEYAQFVVADRMVELDSEYHFAYIMIDQGYGNTIIERIREQTRLGFTTLGERLEDINFGHQIKKPNILTGDMESTYVKPFIVRSAASLLEVGKLVLPEQQREPGGVVYLMKSFFQIGTTKTGVPQYTESNDHTIIAYMLALVGFILKLDHMFAIGQNDMASVPVKTTAALTTRIRIESTYGDGADVSDWSTEISAKLQAVAPSFGMSVTRKSSVGEYSNLPPSERPKSGRSGLQGMRGRRLRKGASIGSRGL